MERTFTSTLVTRAQPVDLILLLQLVHRWSPVGQAESFLDRRKAERTMSTDASDLRQR